MDYSFREKLATLRSTGEAVRKRRREFMERPEAINQFGQCMQLAQKAVDSFKAGDEKFNHLDTAEVEKVQKAIAEKQDWFSRMCADVSKLVSFLLHFLPIHMYIFLFSGQDLRPPCVGLPVLPGEGVVLAHGQQHTQQTQA